MVLAQTVFVAYRLEREWRPTLFLEDTPHKGNEEVLHSFFTRMPELATTVDLHLDAFVEIVAYMEQHIMRYAVSIPPHDGMWVPMISFATYIRVIAHSPRD